MDEAASDYYGRRCRRLNITSMLYSRLTRRPHNIILRQSLAKCLLIRGIKICVPKIVVGIYIMIYYRLHFLSYIYTPFTIFRGYLHTRFIINSSVDCIYTAPAQVYVFLTGISYRIQETVVAPEAAGRRRRRHRLYIDRRAFASSPRSAALVTYLLISLYTIK